MNTSSASDGAASAASGHEFDSITEVLCSDFEDMNVRPSLKQPPRSSSNYPAKKPRIQLKQTTAVIKPSKNGKSSSSTAIDSAPKLDVSFLNNLTPFERKNAILFIKDQASRMAKKEVKKEMEKLIKENIEPLSMQVSEAIATSKAAMTSSENTSIECQVNAAQFEQAIDATNKRANEALLIADAVSQESERNTVGLAILSAAAMTVAIDNSYRLDTHEGKMDILYNNAEYLMNRVGPESDGDESEYEPESDGDESEYEFDGEESGYESDEDETGSLFPTPTVVTSTPSAGSLARQTTYSTEDDFEDCAMAMRKVLRKHLRESGNDYSRLKKPRTEL